MRFSKTDLVWASRCRKALWYRRHARYLAAEPSRERALVLEDGERVDALAMSAFPGGTAVTERSLVEAERATRSAIRASVRRIYQGTATTSWGGCRADILDVHADGSVTIREVKSTASAHVEHTLDVAIQASIFEHAGLPIRAAYVVHVDRSAVSPLGRGAFAEVDVTPAARESITEIPALARTAADTCALHSAPEVPLGPRCSHPFPCPFRPHCWKNVPEDSVLAVPGVSPSTLRRWRRRGVKRISDIPRAARLNARASQFLEHVRDGYRRDERVLRAWSALLVHPITVLSFVSDRSVIPHVDGLHPFEPLPVAAAVQPLDRDTPTVSAGDRNELRRSIGAFVASTLPESGTIVVYSEPHRAATGSRDIEAARTLRRLATYSDAATAARLRSAILRLLDVRPVVTRALRGPSLAVGTSLGAAAAAVGAATQRGTDAETVIARDYLSGGTETDVVGLAAWSSQALRSVVRGLAGPP